LSELEPSVVTSARCSRAPRCPVTLIGRPIHVDAINAMGLFLERSDFQGYVKVEADTRIESVRNATIVLLCVKTIDTETAAAEIAPHLAGGRASGQFSKRCR
jgi:ketopantoate reductase